MAKKRSSAALANESGTNSRKNISSADATALGQKAIQAHWAALAKKGGTNSRKNMSSADATVLGQKAVQARWARWRAENGMPAKEGDEKYVQR